MVSRRKAIDTEKDPYLRDASPVDLSACKRCSAVYHGKRWYLPADVPAGVAGRKAAEVTCPACRKIIDNYAEGYVTLEGSFVADHRDEILGLVRNKEAIAMRNNPLERIIRIEERDGGVHITTTTEKLAQRIGQMLKKSFSGEVEYKWSDDVKLARVVWKRESKV